MKSSVLSILILSSAALGAPLPQTPTDPTTPVIQSSPTNNTNSALAAADADPDAAISALLNAETNNPLPPTAPASTPATGGVTSQGLYKTLPSHSAISQKLSLLLGVAAKLPIVNCKLAALGATLLKLQAVMAAKLKIDTIENETGCTAMTVVFARGTAEMGNVGLLAGPAFFDAMEATVGKKALTVMGVNYGATVEGFFEGGDDDGSALMALMVSNQLKACPSTKLVMSGYSQGGQLVHKAAALLPATTMAQVNSVVIFGDPLFGEPVDNIDDSNVKVICHADDNICQHGDLVLASHLTYSKDAVEAATFATAQAGLSLGDLLD